MTSFDARWKTDSVVDQPERRTEHSECYSNTVQTCESLLHYAVTLLQNAQVCTRSNRKTWVRSSSLIRPLAVRKIRLIYTLYKGSFPGFEKRVLPCEKRKKIWNVVEEGNRC